MMKMYLPSHYIYVLLYDKAVPSNKLTCLACGKHACGSRCEEELRLSLNSSQVTYRNDDHSKFLCLVVV